MKPHLIPLLLTSILLTGCARLTNIATFRGLSEIPAMTEPDLDDE